MGRGIRSIYIELGRFDHSKSSPKALWPKLVEVSPCTESPSISALLHTKQCFYAIILWCARTNIFSFEHNYYRGRLTGLHRSIIPLSSTGFLDFTGTLAQTSSSTTTVAKCCTRPLKNVIHPCRVTPEKETYRLAWLASARACSHESPTNVEETFPSACNCTPIEQLWKGVEVRVSFSIWATTVSRTSHSCSETAYQHVWLLKCHTEWRQHGESNGRQKDGQFHGTTHQ